MDVHGNGGFGIGSEVEDNQQAIAFSLLPIDALRSSNATPALTLEIRLVSDKEIGINHSVSHIFVAADCLLRKNDFIWSATFCQNTIKQT